MAQDHGRMKRTMRPQTTLGRGGWKRRMKIQTGHKEQASAEVNTAPTLGWPSLLLPASGRSEIRHTKLRVIAPREVRSGPYAW